MARVRDAIGWVSDSLWDWLPWAPLFSSGMGFSSWYSGISPLGPGFETLSVGFQIHFGIGSRGPHSSPVAWVLVVGIAVSRRLM